MERGGWEQSAEAWIASMGNHGDWLRRWVLDAPMAELARIPRRALDVGCGEGRFARVLADRGAHVVALDPVVSFLQHGRSVDRRPLPVCASGEQLPFRDASFDLVVTYLTLIDIPDFRSAIREMSRVLEPGGRLLIANLCPHATTGDGWVKDGQGNRMHFPIDRYLDEFSQWFEWRGIRIENYHRPLESYIGALLQTGLVLREFREPRPIDVAPDAETYVRVPWAHVMLWEKP